MQKEEKSLRDLQITHGGANPGSTVLWSVGSLPLGNSDSKQSSGHIELNLLEKGQITHLYVCKSISINGGQFLDGSFIMEGRERRVQGVIALHTYYVVRIEEVCFSDHYLVLFAAPAGL